MANATQKLVKSSKSSKASDEQEANVADNDTEKAETAKSTTKASTAKPKTGNTKATASKAKASTSKTSTKSKASTQSSDLIVSTSKEVESMSGEAAFTEVPRLLDASAFNDFKLGGVLSVIQSDEEVWQEHGYSSFRECIENEFNVAYRKGMHLISIYKDIVESGVPWSKVSGIGWTKLKEISGIINDDNVDSWVEKANNMSTLQLIEAVKNAQKAPESENGDTTGEQPASQVSTKTFKLHADQRENVDAALEKAKNDSGSDVAAVQLDFICADFMAGGKQKAKSFQPSKVTDKQLHKLFETKGWETILEAFGEVFPDIDVSVEVPEGEDEEDSGESEEETEAAEPETEEESEGEEPDGEESESEESEEPDDEESEEDEEQGDD